MKNLNTILKESLVNGNVKNIPISNLSVWKVKWNNEKNTAYIVAVTKLDTLNKMDKGKLSKNVINAWTERLKSDGIIGLGIYYGKSVGYNICSDPEFLKLQKTGVFMGSITAEDFNKEYFEKHKLISYFKE